MSEIESLDASKRQELYETLFQSIEQQFGEFIERGPHIIAVPYNNPKGEKKAIQAYKDAHPFSDLDNDLVVYAVRFSKPDAQVPKKAKQEMVKEPEQAPGRDFTMPEPLDRLPGDALGPEPPQTPEEQPRRPNLDWLVDFVDGPPEVRREAESKVTKLEDHRRKDRARGPHSWM